MNTSSSSTTSSEQSLILISTLNEQSTFSHYGHFHHRNLACSYRRFNFRLQNIIKHLSFDHFLILVSYTCIRTYRFCQSLQNAI